MIIGRLTGSLRARLLGATLATAAVTLVALVALVILRAGQTLENQALEVSHWSEAQLSDRLFSDVRLAGARLASQQDDVGRRFATLAKRWDVSKAIFSGNTVAASELLRPALKLADLDGVIAFDIHMRALTADRVDAELLEANAAIRGSVLAPLISSLLVHNDPDNPKGFVTSVHLDAKTTAALASDDTGQIVEIFGQPTFDDFGEVIGVLVGYRVMRPREPILESFAEMSRRDVLVLDGSTVVSSAGAAFSDVRLGQDLGSGLRPLVGLRKVARCQAMEPGLNLCAAASLSELEHLTGKVVGIGEENSRSLLTTLCVAAVAALGLFALVSLFLSNRITRPLVRISETVAEVARGNWHMRVPDIGRADEVGDIARAVVKLEHSLEERDQLRVDVVKQNSVLTEREMQLREQNGRFNAALNNMSQGLCMFDETGHLKVFNEQFLRVYRLVPGAIALGATIDAVRGITGLTLGLVKGASTSAREAGTRTVELTDGRMVEIATQTMADGGHVETHEDVTESRTSQARISHLATHDALTGLPNRVLLAERLAKAFAQRAANGCAVCVLCLDLDDFKGVNDSLGHAAGDELLVKVGRRLTEVAPGGATVARLGGDEFAILLAGSELPARALALADAIVTRMKQPFLVAGQVVASNASLGIAVTLAPGDDADGLLRRADLALYDAKAVGRGRVRMFEPAMEERLHHRRWLERDLREALRTNQIELHYQPLFGVNSNEIHSFEALARWRHPERGAISPGEFIPLAETVGLIDALGEYVLSRACLDAVHWPGNVRVAVNVSPVQFRNPDLDRMVEQILRRTGLPSSRLELEITESVVLNQDSNTHDMLDRLRRLGVRFSMDDFGTGYSSLSSLNNFRFDKIKLDQSFVRDVTNRDESAAIVNVVAELGRSLKITTTAEGVETSQQLQRLKASGFSEVQGFLFSAAVPAREVKAMLARTNRIRSAAA